VQPAGWINIDGSHRAWLASKLSRLDRLLTRLGVLPPTEFGPQIRFHNLRRRLPFADGSVACIYAGELWEHLVPQDAEALTAECHRVLSPGGVLRLCVPDGPTFWERYLELYRDAKDRGRDPHHLSNLKAHVGMYFHDICTRRTILRSMGHYHKWQYDDLQLVDLLERAGFADVERAEFHRSRMPDVASVERSDFLIVEGVKARPLAAGAEAPPSLRALVPRGEPRSSRLESAAGGRRDRQLSGR
jgi:predicted SAM-dependent methyltransferase